MYSQFTIAQYFTLIGLLLSACLFLLLSEIAARADNARKLVEMTNKAGLPTGGVSWSLFMLLLYFHSLVFFD